MKNNSKLIKLDEKNCRYKFSLYQNFEVHKCHCIVIKESIMLLVPRSNTVMTDEWEEFGEMKEARAVHENSTVLVNDILDHC